MVYINTFRVFSGFDTIEKLYIWEIIHVYFAFHNDNNLISLESDTFDVGSKAELCYALRLVVIPQHDLIRWIFRRIATSNKCKDVASIQHFYDTNTTTKFFKILIYSQYKLVPLEKVSLKGLVEKILKPFWVPTAKQPIGVKKEQRRDIPWSWLKLQ